MRKFKFLLVVLVLVSFQFCKQNRSNKSDQNKYDSEKYYDEDELYPDDTYCAEVSYYNPDTGFSNEYTLNVEVSDNELVKIYFSSGWLDDSEFNSVELDDEGYCEIVTYDGKEYEIQIVGSACSWAD